MTKRESRVVWEIEYCITFNHMAFYLNAMNLTGTKKDLFCTSFDLYSAKELKEWCEKKVAELALRCGEMIEKNGPLSERSLAQVQGTIQALDEQGWFPMIGLARVREGEN